MKHTVTITKAQFEDSDYSDQYNCALAKALIATFPNNSFKVLGFRFIIDENFEIYFDKCDIINPEEHPDKKLEDLILDYCKCKVEPVDLTFTFRTASWKPSF